MSQIASPASPVSPPNAEPKGKPGQAVGSVGIPVTDTRNYLMKVLGLGGEEDDLVKEILTPFLTWPMPSFWTEKTDSKERTFYWNAVTKQSNWSHPNEPVFRQVIQGCRFSAGNPHLLKSFLDTALNNYSEQLEKWRPAQSRTTGQTYYYNAESLVTRWDNPHEEIKISMTLLETTVCQLWTEFVLATMHSASIARGSLPASGFPTVDLASPNNQPLNSAMAALMSRVTQYPLPKPFICISIDSKKVYLNKNTNKADPLHPLLLFYRKLAQALQSPSVQLPALLNFVKEEPAGSKASEPGFGNVKRAANSGEVAHLKLVKLLAVRDAWIRTLNNPFPETPAKVFDWLPVDFSRPQSAVSDAVGLTTRTRPSTANLGLAVYRGFNYWYEKKMPALKKQDLPAALRMDPPTPRKDKHRMQGTPTVEILPKPAAKHSEGLAQTERNPRNYHVTEKLVIARPIPNFRLQRSPGVQVDHWREVMEEVDSERKLLEDEVALLREELKVKTFTEAFNRPATAGDDGVSHSNPFSRRLEVLEYVSRVFKGDIDEAVRYLAGGFGKEDIFEKSFVQFFSRFDSTKLPLPARDMFLALDTRSTGVLHRQDLELGTETELRLAERILDAAVKSVLIQCAQDAKLKLRRPKPKHRQLKGKNVAL